MTKFLYYGAWPRRIDLSKVKNYFVIGIVFLVAIITGVAIGSVYVDGLVPTVDTSGLSETSLRDDEGVIEALYNDAISGRKTSFTAVELYQIGEYKLEHETTRYVKILSGDVSAGVGPISVPQEMRAIKTSTEDGIYYLKMSPSQNSMAPSMAVKQIYEYDKPNEIYLNETRSIENIVGDSKENYTVDLDESTAKIWTIEQYKQFFNTEPTTPLTYIISSKTCAEGNYDKDVTLNGDDQYVFNIKLTGPYATYAALYYSYEIRHFSESTIPTTPPTSSDLPSWKSVDIQVTMDENFNILSMHYIEVYNVKKMGIDATVTDTFDDVFYYDEATIQECLAML